MFKTYQIIRSNKSWCFVFLVCLFSSRKRQPMWSSDIIHYMMFWRVPNKMEQRTELTGFYVVVFMRIETIMSNFMRNWQFYNELGVADCNVTQLWCQRTVDTWKKLLADNASTYCVQTRWAKCPCFHPNTLQSRLWPVQLYFLGEKAETGRAEAFNRYMVCQYLSFQSSWLFPSS